MTKKPEMADQLRQFVDEASAHATLYGNTWHAIARETPEWFQWMVYLHNRGVGRECVALCRYTAGLRTLMAITMPSRTPGEFDPSFTSPATVCRERYEAYMRKQRTRPGMPRDREAMAAKYGIRVEDLVTAEDIVDMAAKGPVRFAADHPRKRERSLEEIIADVTNAKLSPDSVRRMGGHPAGMDTPAKPHSASQAATADPVGPTLPADDDLPF